MTMRYSHLSDAYLRAAINTVNLGAHASGGLQGGTYLAPGEIAGKSETKKALI
jgi:hypothetical protein